MYDSLNDLPFVCRLNLPEPAQKVWQDAFNRAWLRAREEKSRHQVAQSQAWMEVRARFEREKETGRWVAKG